MPVAPIFIDPSAISALYNQRVLEIHAQEAATAWMLRDAACTRSSHALDDLAERDERLVAHLAGLSIAGVRGLQIARDTLSLLGADETFVLTLLTLWSGTTAELDALLGAAANDDEQQRGAIAALAWADFAQAEPLLLRLAAAPQPALRSIAVSAYAAHRRDPGQLLRDAIFDPDQALRAAVYRAAGQLGRRDLFPALVNAASTPAGPEHGEACRYFAAWAAARLGDRSKAVLQTLADVACGDSPLNLAATDLLVRCLDREQAQAFCEEAKDNGHLRVAVRAAGSLGAPELVPLLVAMMQVQHTARLAGEAFATLTGVDMDLLDLVAEDQQPHERDDDNDDNNNDDNDDNLEEIEELDGHLPWPDAQQVWDFWVANSARFAAQTRHLMGLPISAANLPVVLAQGNQLQRAAAALELSLRAPTEPLFEIRAPAPRQREVG